MRRAHAVLLILACSGSLAWGALPVFDAAGYSQQLQQVSAWTRQFNQMREQYQQLERQYAALTGSRNLGALARSELASSYLPADYSQLLRDGTRASDDIRSAARMFDLKSTSLSTASQAAMAYEGRARQAALDRAIAEASYREAALHFDNVRTLTNQIDAARDPKAIADLQARIAAEQLQVQNQANRLASLQQLQVSQQALADQRSLEVRLSSISRALPQGW